MKLLVDTYNVLHVTGVLPPEQAGIDVAGLIGLVQRSRYRQRRVELICDGTPPDGLGEGSVSGVRLRYAGAARKADELIIDMVNRSTAPRRLCIVSSDQEILRAARKRRCRTMSSEEFLQHLAEDAGRAQAESSAPPRKPPGGLSETQVQQWIDAFGIDVNAIEAEVTRESTRAKPARTGEVTSGAAGGQAAKSVPGEAEDSRDDHHRGPNLPDEVIREAERMLEDEETLD